MMSLQRKSAKTSGLEEESLKSNVPTGRVPATDSLGNGSTQGPVLYRSGPSTGSLHQSRGRASPAQECRLSALDGLAAGSRESLRAGLLGLPRPVPRRKPRPAPQSSSSSSQGLFLLSFPRDSTQIHLEEN